MWVEPWARGARIGARLVQALIGRAQAMNCNVVRLETGIYQPEAIALYRQEGFVECAPFGDYRVDPLSLFMERRI
jgi:putative acetyltransferase